jgi:RNA methyltransferase, TrmH family
MGKDYTDDMITSSANQQMKHLSQLMKRAKERKKEQVFVVEGIKMFQEAPADTVVSVYVSESFLEKPEHEKCLQGYRYEVVSDAVFREISDTQTPQGILAIVRMPKYDLPDLLQGDHTHLLILESVQDPGNLGTMVRTGEGAGITGIIMNKTTVDLFNPKTIRSTMGSIYRVPYLITEHLPDLLDELHKENIRLYAAHLKGDTYYDAFEIPLYSHQTRSVFPDPTSDRLLQAHEKSYVYVYPPYHLLWFPILISVCFPRF